MESFRYGEAPAVKKVPASKKMKASVGKVEKIIGYNFTNKKHLEVALKHYYSSSSGSTDSATFKRLALFGDAIIGFAISHHFFYASLQEPQLTARELSWLRTVHVQNNELARVARLNIYDKVKSLFPVRKHKVKGDSKMLADIVESIAAAVYIDLNGDLEKLWPILKGLLKPRVNIIEEIRVLKGLLEEPSVDMIKEIWKLHEICQKLQSKQVEIKHTEDSGSEFTASVYVDGQNVAEVSSDELDTARRNAAKLALSNLPQSTPAADDDKSETAPFETEAKGKLDQICQKKRWILPSYKIEKQGPQRKKTEIISSVVVVTSDRVIYKRGDRKKKLTDSEKSAASLMIHYLELEKLISR